MYMGYAVNVIIAFSNTVIFSLVYCAHTYKTCPGIHKAHILPNKHDSVHPNSRLAQTRGPVENAVLCPSFVAGSDAMCICSHTSRRLNINSTIYPNGLFTEHSLASLINKGPLCLCCCALAKMWAFVCALWESKKSMLGSICKEREEKENGNGNERACARLCCCTVKNNSQY